MRRSNEPAKRRAALPFTRRKGNDRPVVAAPQTPPRDVPAHITRPPYIPSGMPGPRSEPMVKDDATLVRMRRAGRLAAQVRDEAVAAATVGTTTDQLDALVHQLIVDGGGYPSPLGYRGFPKSVCTSVNEVICHGIPDLRPLADGDIVNVDVTVYLDGVHGDTSAMALVGDVDEESARLVQITRECFEQGIAAVAPGRPIRDIGKAVQAHAEAHGYGVVRAFVGHGIGEQFHGAPMIVHHDDPAATQLMEPGMTFTIEPMLTIGNWRHRMWDDGWTAVTVDGGRSAQFEHTLVVTETGAHILTAP